MAAAVWEHNQMHRCNIQNTTVWIPMFFPGSKTCTWNWLCGWHYRSSIRDRRVYTVSSLFYDAQELGTHLVCGFAVYYEQ